MENTAIGDARFENQRIFCRNHNVPMFANRFCSHDVTWSELGNGDGSRYEGKNHDIWAAYITDYQSMTTHIVSCPVCGKSFCD